jgi:hypothetical protein
MDGVAAYSSDEDEDLVSDSSTSAAHLSKDKEETNVSELGMGTSIQQQPQQEQQQQRPTSAVTSSSSNIIFVNEDTASTPMPKKKRCRSDDNGQRDDQGHNDSSFLSQNQLPKPTLTKNEVALFGWKNEYISWNSVPSNPNSDNNDDGADIVPPSFSKFQALSKSILLSSKNNVDMSSCWAAHLREQHEFHNPHFFQSVVEYFAIQEPMGSHMDSNKQSMLTRRKDNNENA